MKRCFRPFAAPIYLALLLAILTLGTARPALAGTETLLHVFTGQPDGANPNSALTADAAGNLFGVTQSGGAYNFGTVYELSPPAAAGGAWTYQIIYNFTGGNDGSVPTTDLLYDSHSGALFGATGEGGGTSNCSRGCGVVFQLKPPITPGGAWTQKTIYHLQGGTDGWYPGPGNMLRDSSGSIYLTTMFGGIFEFGRALKLTSGVGGNWAETTLLDFNYNPVGNPSNGMAFDSKGNLLGNAYGQFKLTAPTLQYPYWNDASIGGCGANSDLAIDKYNVLYVSCPNNFNDYGDVATLSPQPGIWKMTVLYTFTGGADGWAPLSGLYRDSTHNVLYGTTHWGGLSCANSANGCGVVYKLTKTGTTWAYSTLYSFLGGNDGWAPGAPRLYLDSANNLYGVTGEGGSTTLNNGNGWGVVYKITQ